MKVITPDDISLHDALPSVDLFLAGGITNCPDWQIEAIRLLGNQDIVVANPRRNRLLASEGAETALLQIHHGGWQSVPALNPNGAQ